MIRIFHIADSHFDERSRFDECCRIHSEFVAHVEHEKPDLVLHAGDVFTRRSTPIEMAAAERFFQRVAHTCPVVIVRGNHDAALEIENFQRLRAPYPIYGIEEPRVITEAGVAIACLPWPSKAGVIMQSKDLDLETAGGEAIDHLQAILRWLGSELDEIDPEIPRVLLAHAMVRGSKTTSGQPLVGCDFELGVEDLALSNRVGSVMLGHVHMAQGFDSGTVYPGSPYHSDFGDRGEKGFVEWKIDDRRCVWRHVSLPATPMYQYTGHWDNDRRAIVADPIETPAFPCEIKLSYTVDAEHSAAAKAFAAEWKAQRERDGAINVVLDPQINVVTRARAPEVAAATTTADQLRAYWASLGDQASPTDAQTRMLDKLAEIEVMQ